VQRSLERADGPDDRGVQVGESAVGCEVLHGVAALEQGVGLGVDLGDARGVDDDAGEAFPDVRIANGWLLLL
jgi:hypothetical protein